MYEFEYPFMVKGKEAAYLYCRCRIDGEYGEPQSGSTPDTYDPGTDSKITEICDVEIEVCSGEKDPETGLHKTLWVSPENELENQIIAWLWEQTDKKMTDMLESMD